MGMKTTATRVLWLARQIASCMEQPHQRASKSGALFSRRDPTKPSARLTTKTRRRSRSTRPTFCGRFDKGLKGSYPSGIWLGGVKHTLVREQELEVEGQNVMMRALGRPKGGCVIACSKDSIVLAFFDEDKGQKSGNATNACLKFVGYLFQNE